MMNKINSYFNKYFYVLIAILFSIQSYFYINHIVNDYKLLNEYRYIDEVTILNGKEVLNSEYIEQNLLFNPHEKKIYNSTNNVFILGKQQYSFNYIPNSLVLSKKEYKAYENFLNDNLVLRFPTISYSDKLEMLYSDYIQQENYIQQDIYIQQDNFKNYPMIQSDSIDNLKEKIEFIKYNIYEQNMQIFDRYYFHENSFMLSPINEMNLKRDTKEIFSQYGFLSVSAINYIMDIYGGFSLNNYEKAKKTIDQLYFLFSIILILLLFKDNYLRMGFVLILGIAFFGNKYYSFSYAPTVTNSRHFLDLFIIFLLYKYNSEDFKKIYLVIAIALSILSIFIAKDFGQFIFLAILGVLIIPLAKEYLEVRKINIFITISLCLTLLCGYFALKYYPMMENPSIKYFLDGFYSFPFSNNIIYFIVLFIVFIQWFALIFFYDRLKVAYLYTYIFIILYTQFLYTYFIWHGSINNIIIYAYLFILPTMIIYNQFQFKYKFYISAIIVLILSFVYFKTLNAFIIEKNNYDQVFKTHKLYKWENERAGGIIATYSFDNFQNSIDLIKKHSVSNEIYMISKYDNILGILSEKYSGFPFFELRSTIVTIEEYNQVKSIIEAKAEILFVDNDIDRDFDAEMKKMSFFDLDPFWRDESL